MRKRIAIILFILVAIPLAFSLVPGKAYSSPEEYCLEQGRQEYLSATGESSVCILYQTERSDIDFAFLKQSKTGYVSSGYQMVHKELRGPYYPTIYRVRGTDDHYIVLILSGDNKTPEIADTLGSAFSFLPVHIHVEQQEMEIALFAVAFIGTAPDSYYRQGYQYYVETNDESLP